MGVESGSNLCVRAPTPIYKTVTLTFSRSFRDSAECKLLHSSRLALYVFNWLRHSCKEEQILILFR